MQQYNLRRRVANGSNARQADDEILKSAASDEIYNVSKATQDKQKATTSSKAYNDYCLHDAMSEQSKSSKRLKYAKFGLRQPNNENGDDDVPMIDSNNPDMSRPNQREPRASKQNLMSGLTNQKGVSSVRGADFDDMPDEGQSAEEYGSCCNQGRHPSSESSDDDDSPLDDLPFGENTDMLDMTRSLMDDVLNQCPGRFARVLRRVDDVLTSVHEAYPLTHYEYQSLMGFAYCFRSLFDKSIALVNDNKMMKDEVERLKMKLHEIARFCGEEVTE